MRVLFIGDVVGKPGRRMLTRHLDSLVDQHRVDFIVANAENAAGGFGVTPEIAAELFDLGPQFAPGPVVARGRLAGLQRLDLAHPGAEPPVGRFGQTPRSWSGRDNRCHGTLHIPRDETARDR